MRSPLASTLLLLSGMLLMAPTCGGGTYLVTPGDTWRNWDQGSLDSSPDWMTAAYPDTAWGSGASELGFGDGDEATVLGFGGDPQNVHPFRPG
ncbi:MAG: hypothetical protein GY788_24810 [bacterium]|nr:hypothetical protein [bacterium]